MTITLPDAGWTVLSGFLNSITFPIALFIGLGLLLKARWETISCCYTEDYFSTISFIPLSVMAVVGLSFDLLLPGFRNELFQRVHLVSRNTLALILGLGVFVCLNRSHLHYKRLFGRLQPPAKLLFLGIITFLGVGIGFWGLSYFVPFSVAVAPAEPMTINTVTILILSIVLIPLTEELIFRFHLYSYLRETVGILPGIVMTSLIFSLLHGLGKPIMPVFFGAIIMSVLTEFTGSILPPLTVHAGFNFLLLCGGYWLPV